MLTRHRAEDGRRSLFERAEIERLAARSRRGGRAAGLEVSSTRASRASTPRAASTTAARTRRSSPASAASKRSRSCLWTGETQRRRRAVGSAASGGSRSTPGLGRAGARLVDRIRVIVALAAAADPLRNDLRPPARPAHRRSADRRDGRRAAAAVRAGEREHRRAVCGRACTTSAHADRLHALERRARPARRPRARDLGAVARVAASAWADPYLVVLAGLSASAARCTAARPERSSGCSPSIRTPSDVPAVLGERLATGAPLPGFGHAIYQGR
jgi:citrate synthase